MAATRETSAVLNSRIDGGADAVEELFSAGLVRFTPEGEPSAQLAEVVPTLENGLWRVFPDGRMETTWRIKDGVKWHDGTPFTADDLVFTVQVNQDREIPEFSHAGFNSLDDVRADDSRTLTAMWKTPYIQADFMFSFQWALPLPRHLLETAYVNSKQVFTQQLYWSRDYVGMGPYKVRSFVPAERLILEANPDYVFGRPTVDEIEVRYITDANTIVANLLSGDVLLSLGPGVSVDQALQVKERWTDGRLEVYPYYGTNVATAQMTNPSPSALAQVQFRRALVHALDRQALIESVQGGLGAVSGFIVPPGAPEFEAVKPAVVDYPYDPRRAVQLIEDLGYRRGGDGIFRDPAGQDLSVEIMVESGDDARERATLVAADNWSRIGLRGTPRILSSELSTAERNEARALRPGFEVAGQTVAMSDPRRLADFNSRDVPTQERRWQGRNRARLQSPEMDEIVDRFFSTVSRSDRIELLKQAASHLTDQVVVISLFHPASPTLISNRLEGVTPRTIRTQNWDAHKWVLR